MTKVIAHRAGRYFYGENTILSAKESIKIGCDYIEVDLRQIFDGSFIISNTEVVEYKENTPPMLVDFIKVIKNENIGILIDIKGDISESSLLKEIGNLKSRVVLMSSQLKILQQLRKLNKTAKLAYLAPSFSTDIIDSVFNTTNIIAIGDKTSTPTMELINYATLKGNEVWGFTINEVEHMKKMVKLGVSGIITDFPQKLLALIKTETPFQK